MCASTRILEVVSKVGDKLGAKGLAGRTEDVIAETKKDLEMQILRRGIK